MDQINLISQLENLSLDQSKRSQILGLLRRLKMNKGYWLVAGGSEAVIFDEPKQTRPRV